MPFNGNGTFNRIFSWVVDAANNVNISSTRTDSEMNGFAAGLTNCITRDGQSPPSADIPWGAKRLINLGAATAGTDALNRDTADVRYLLASGVTNFTLSGTLSAAVGAFSGNVTVGGTLSVTSGAQFTGFVTILDWIRAANGFGIQFTDLSGTNPLFVCDGANNLVLYGTTATGGMLQLFSVGMRNSSPTFAFNVSTAGLTPTAGDNSTKFATTAFVVTALAAALAPYAPLASPALTGAPTAPNAAAGTATTQLATTAFVQSAIALSIQSVTSAATVTPLGTNDQVDITAQAVALTIANPSPAPVDGWGTVLRIKDNGTPQTIAFGTQYRGVGSTPPTTTVASKTLYVGCVWNNADTKFDIVSVAQQ